MRRFLLVVAVLAAPGIFVSTSSAQGPDSLGNTIDNPNQFFVFGFTDVDLVLQQFK